MESLLLMKDRGIPWGPDIPSARIFDFVMCPVYYLGQNFLGKGYVREISLNGWRIEGDHTVYPGLILTLAVFIPNEPKAMRVENAVVRWARDGSFGLRILRMKPDESERLARAITTLVQQQLMLALMPRSFGFSGSAKHIGC